MPLNETRHLLALDDDELEELIKKWIARVIRDRGEYVGFDRPTASADEGRDAVGFVTARRYDDAWDNYQCKHLKKPLGSTEFFIELGKMFFYAERGDYVLPRRYFFVAPNSAARDVLKLIDRPGKIGSALIAAWDTHCKTGITKSGTPMTPSIEAAISRYEFENVFLWKSTDIVEQKHMRAVMAEELGFDPGSAPTLRTEDIPLTPGAEEAVYLGQLRKVYGDHRGKHFIDHDAIMADADFSEKITRARRQFLEREAFRRHFRDNLDNTLIDQVDADVLDGVQDCYDSYYDKSTYDRLIGVIGMAANSDVSGPLGKHRRVTPRVKQGVCHFHASSGKKPLRWDK